MPRVATAVIERMYEGKGTTGDLLAFAGEVGYQLVGYYERAFVCDWRNYFDARFVADGPRQSVAKFGSRE